MGRCATTPEPVGVHSGWTRRGLAGYFSTMTNAANSSRVEGMVRDPLARCGRSLGVLLGPELSAI